MIYRIFFSIIFVVFAYLQLNDPDPIKWVIAYVAVSINLILPMVWKSSDAIIKINYALFGLYILWGMTFLGDFYDWAMQGFPAITGAMNYKDTYIELVREGIGLILCIMAIGLNLKFVKGK